jgi:hypothetical protein
MSAFGPKRTFLFAPHISAFEDKADMLTTFGWGRLALERQPATRPL